MSITTLRNNQTQTPRNIVNHAPSMTERVIRNAHKVAIPAIALAGLALIPGADAGPIVGGWCLLACVPLVEAPPLLALCIAACSVAAVGPTP